MATATQTRASGIEIVADVPREAAHILTPFALEFVAGLERRTRARRRDLLVTRKLRQARLDAGELPDFLEETAEVRESNWRVRPAPDDLQDRRVEITGPVDRKMVINALNSGAKTFMADFEDSHAPTWRGTLAGQVNLRDTVAGTIDYTSPEGKYYSLDRQTATLIVRPRGWHLDEKHLLVDGQPISASIFDFGLYFYHNAEALLAKGTGPYFYLPKLESHREARLWNDVFLWAQSELGIAPGTIKATVLIETILAAFEMDEILYELRDHVVGLNCGRWDYIFSFIKKFRGRPDFVLPDRSQVTMTTHFLRSYSRLLIETCHRRGAHAMGGMAAQIPIKNDPEANQQAIEKVRADKLREVSDGHDGTWVAHPGLVQTAMQIFDEQMQAANQIDRATELCGVMAADLLSVPKGTITLEGLRTNVAVGLRYLQSWLAGNGCVPIFNLMEDAATAEISRAQIWQWIRHPAGQLEDGTKITRELVAQVLDEEVARIRDSLGPLGYDTTRYPEAAELFLAISTAETFVEFLTLPAYEQLE
ncbi:MAG TPA: malate synthase A [Pirellulales bacterium]|jgi:malate synthase|nr:malate synthase A [Pirellulales bacterium]